MQDLVKEERFLKDIALKVRELVRSSSSHPSVAVQKGMSRDYATEVDIAVENVIVAAIQAEFPTDKVLAEEGHSNTPIGMERIWIIDPICGTNNLGRGISIYCSNIALADAGQLVASCVVDHSCGDILYSVGDGKVFLNGDPLPPAPKGLGITIDADPGSLGDMDKAIKSRYCRFLEKLLIETDYFPIGLNSSITFLYTAMGKVDGFINMSAHPWDMCAAMFLMQQAGCTISDLEGNPWQITTDGTIAALDPVVHRTLLELYLSAKN
jgi:myo-inositol-1(or 4)-monophosphatase